MPSCFACNRTRNSLTKQQNITFHKFPTNVIVKNKWYEFVTKHGSNVNDINKRSLLCSKHFDSSLFVTLPSGRRLLQNAIPNILITRVKNAKTVYPEITEVCQSSTILSTKPLKCNRVLMKLSANGRDCEIISTTNEEYSQSDVSIQTNSFQNVFSDNHSEQVSATKIHCADVSPLDTSTQSNMSYQNDPKTTFIQKNMDTAKNIAVEGTPMQLMYERKIRQLSDKNKLKDKEIKLLRQKVRRKDKKIASLKTTIQKLEKENLIDEDGSDMLSDSYYGVLSPSSLPDDSEDLELIHMESI